MIELSGYTEEEKLGIAERHLLPKQLGLHGFSARSWRCPTRCCDP